MGIALHVGNLSASTTDDELLVRFGDHGAVESATVSRDPYTGSSKRVACVVMLHDEEAQAAIDWLHLSQFDGQTISVNRVLTH
jgi:RNA recognition motif-containing protein